MWSHVRRASEYMSNSRLWVYTALFKDVTILGVYIGLAVWLWNFAQNNFITVSVGQELPPLYRERGGSTGRGWAFFFFFHVIILMLPVYAANCLWFKPIECRRLHKANVRRNGGQLQEDDRRKRVTCTARWLTILTVFLVAIQVTVAVKAWVSTAQWIMEDFVTGSSDLVMANATPSGEFPIGRDDMALMGVLGSLAALHALKSIVCWFLAIMSAERVCQEDYDQLMRGLPRTAVPAPAVVENGPSKDKVLLLLYIDPSFWFF